MLEPIMAVYVVDDDILKDFIQFLFMFGKDKVRISEDFLVRKLGDLMTDQERRFLERKVVLDQPFELFYKYLNLFIDSFPDIPKLMGTHVEFKYNRNVVWKLIEFLIDQDDNVTIKKNIVFNYIKNTDIFFDSDKFCKFVVDSIEEISSTEHPFTLKVVDDTFFFISKIVAISNFVKVNNVVAQSVKKVVSTDEVRFDTESVTDIQEMVDEMSGTALRGSVDELVFDEDNFDLQINNLNYPIVPVKAFKEFKFFQEKRVFLFVGASGVGKSMILCHIASDMWLSSPYNKGPLEAIFYFTMENLKEEVAARIAANAFFTQCGLNRTIDDIVEGNISSDDRNLLWQHVKEKKRVLIIEYLPPKVYGAAMLRMLIKKHIYEKKVTPYAVIVDYLDLLRSENRKIKEEHQELGEVVNELKALGGEFSVPVISVSHLNSEGCQMVKENMKSLGGRQMGKSLRKFENADCITFVDEENTGLEYGVMNFFNSKHRYARKVVSKIVPKMYLPEYAYFEPIKEDRTPYESSLFLKNKQSNMVQTDSTESESSIMLKNQRSSIDEPDELSIIETMIIDETLGL